MKPPIEKLLGNVGSAASSLTALLVIQSVACAVLSSLRTDAVGVTVLQAACASAVLAAASYLARKQVDSAPATAAGMIAAVLAVEVLMWGALLGVPAMPALLQVTLVVFGYGGLTAMAFAAAVACFVLFETDPATVSAAATARRLRERQRRLDRAA